MSNPNVLFLLSVVFAILLVYIAKMLRKKDLVSPEDLQVAIQVLGITTSIADELQLKQVPQIKQISNIIIAALDSLSNVMKSKSKTQLINETVNNVLAMCEVEGIKIDDKKHDLIVQLVTISLNNKYIDQINK